MDCGNEVDTGFASCKAVAKFRHPAFDLLRAAALTEISGHYLSI